MASSAVGSVTPIPFEAAVALGGPASGELSCGRSRPRRSPSTPQIGRRSAVAAASALATASALAFAVVGCGGEPLPQGEADPGPAGDGGVRGAQNELVELEARLTDGADDGLQDPGGPMLIDYDWVSLYSDDHWGALRFSLEGVTANSEIREAWVEVYVDSEEEDNPNLDIRIERSGEAMPLTESPSDISRRAIDGQVPWVDADLGEGWAQSPGLASLLQMAVNDPSWTTGSHVMLVFDARPNTEVEAFEFRQQNHSTGLFGARLVVRYVPAVGLY